MPDNFTKEQMDQDVEKAYQDWFHAYVTSDGAPHQAYRVHMGKAYDFESTSESIGFGMLIMVLMDNQKYNTQKYFDGLYAYYKKYLDAFGLMHWKISKDGKIIKANSATEADENAALALIFAHQQWGNSGKFNYKTEAKSILDRIKKHEIEPGTFVIKPGDTWGGSTATNPIYHSTAYYPIFADFTKDKNWLKIREKSYKMFQYFYDNFETGLVPDWCKANGQPSGKLDYNYLYNACQMPLKFTIEYLWYGNQGSPVPYLMNHRLSAWIQTKTDEDPKKIVDGYTLNGEAIGKYHNAAFVGPMTAATMVLPELQPWLNKMYAYLREMETGGDWGYYQDTLRLLSMLVVTGNFPNLYVNP